jgi:hypothetical protein
MDDVYHHLEQHEAFGREGQSTAELIEKIGATNHQPDAPRNQRQVLRDILILRPNVSTPPGDICACPIDYRLI